MPRFDLSIDKLKSNLFRHGGHSPKNRYYAIISPPISLRGGLWNAWNTMGLFCESTFIPGRRILTSDVQYQKQETKYPYGFIDNNEIDFRFSLPNDYFIKYYFDTWISNIIEQDLYKLAYKDSLVGTVHIHQLDQTNASQYIATLINAYPIAMSDIELSDNASNDYQRVTITMTYDHVRYPIYNVQSAIPESPPINAQQSQSSTLSSVGPISANNSNRGLAVANSLQNYQQINRFTPVNPYSYAVNALNNGLGNAVSQVEIFLTNSINSALGLNFGVNTIAQAQGVASTIANQTTVQNSTVYGTPTVGTPFFNSSISVI